MDSELQEELQAIIAEYGNYPYSFFNILVKSDNPNLDYENQNIVWSDIKKEQWHNLDLGSYTLWCISDNGDLLWSNSERTIAMNPRDSEFMSIPVKPKQFIKLIGMGKITGIFPNQLWE